MSNDDFEVQVQHFAALKSKYQATKSENSSPSSLLYLILRRADLEFEITDFEWNWLLDHELLETIEAIEQEPLRKAEERRKLEAKFSQLKSKFKVTKGLPISSPLYPILWKLDSENQLTDLEVKYLKQQGLTEIVAIVEEMARFAALKAKYRATEYPNCSLDSPLYQILKQLDAREILSDVEANWLFNNQLVDTLEIFWQQKAVREAEFAQLKDKYKASEYPETSVSSPLYPILKNLEVDQQLSESELNWLEEHQLSETLSIVLEIEQTRHFAELKVKYKANKSEDLSRSSHLYKVLKKIDLDNPLGEQDINFLKKRNLTETITIALDKYAASLKSKIQSGEPLSEADFDWVKQNEREDVITFAIDKYAASLKSKIQSGEQLSEADIDWLKQNGREDVITFAIDKYAASLKSKIQSGEQLSEADIDWLKQNGREDVITFAQEKEFAALKVKYRIIDHNFPFDPFYAIMVKLEKEERLDPVLVVQLIQQRLLASHGKIAMAYHRLEALFYDREYERTGDKWNLPNASSHWRKADEPNSALQVTENLDFDQIKENKLKSALLTTRGGAFRDIHKLDDAEKCALKAIEYQPQSHHPYTLMGAICFERGQFSEGERWFKDAIKRGAESEDIDSELKRVVKNTKDEKRREVVEYLLTKNPQRYAWAKAYRKRQGGEDAQRKNS
jgi:type VI protein secretion system component Hcp